MTYFKLTCLYKKCIPLKDYTRPKMKQTLLNKLQVKTVFKTLLLKYE